MSVPKGIRKQLLDNLSKEADDLGWLTLSDAEKSHWYDTWADEASIGGVLGHYRDQQGIRVFIKDSLMKSYTRQAQSDDRSMRRILGVDQRLRVTQTHIKPHGRWYEDGTVAAWGRASGWKLILLTLYERIDGRVDVKCSAIILTHALGRYADLEVRSMVEEAARRLGVDKVIWRGTGLVAQSTPELATLSTLFEAS